MNYEYNLWNDFRKGKNHAISKIYFKYIQILYRYGKIFSHDEELIKDTIQDLFYDLISTRDRLGETDNISFYLMASFRRKLVKNVRFQNLFFYTQDYNDNKKNIDDYCYSSETALIRQEEMTIRIKTVRKAVKQLTAKQQEILFYRYACDFDYDQICEIMELQYDSARKQMYRALQSIKQKISKSDIAIYFVGFFPTKR